MMKLEVKGAVAVFHEASRNNLSSTNKKNFIANRSRVELLTNTETQGKPYLQQKIESRLKTQR